MISRLKIIIKRTPKMVYRGWILVTGFWDDNGKWDNNSYWID